VEDARVGLLDPDVVGHAVEVDVVRVPAGKRSRGAVAEGTHVDAEGGEDVRDAVVGVGDDADDDFLKARASGRVSLVVAKGAQGSQCLRLRLVSIPG
jgi:hypothetical protein